MWIPVIFLLVAITSWFLTGVYLRYAISNQVLDIPNQRSSHQLPTPSGGGIVVAISFFVALFVLYYLKYLEKEPLITYLGSGLILAVIGFWDDCKNVSVRLRLFWQLIAVIWVFYWIGDISGLRLFNVTGMQFQLIIFILIAIYIIWLINLYNFMDGINGIASVEAISVCMCGAFMSWINNTSPEQWMVPIVLLFAVTGFLYWNFPHAKVFMGDSGSGFLGLMLGVFSIQAGLLSAELFWAWFVMLGVFFVDATVTLVRRVLRGEKFYQAHRIHAYQWAARRWGHTRVTITILFINLGWLFPLAYSTTLFSEIRVWIVLLAIVPLVLLAVYLGAGRPEHDPGLQ